MRSARASRSRSRRPSRQRRPPGPHWLRRLPWWLAVAYLPVPLLLQWWFARTEPYDNGDHAAVLATALVVPVLVTFSVSAWRAAPAGRTRWSRMGVAVRRSAVWSLGLCMLLLVPAAGAAVVTGTGSAYVDATTMPPLLLLLWPFALSVVGFYAVTIGGAISMVASAVRGARGGDGGAAGPGLRGTARWCGGAVLLVGAAFLVTGRILDLLQGHHLTAPGRALAPMVAQAWHLRTPGAILVQAGSILVVLGLAVIGAARLLPARAREQVAP